MKTTAIPYQVVDWTEILPSKHSGIQGEAQWQTLQFSGLRIRIVTYGPGYLADHWCRKGHIVHCLEGEFTSELDNGEKTLLTQGMSYIVSDELSAHRSATRDGCRLLIIDGDFLAAP